MEGTLDAKRSVRVGGQAGVERLGPAAAGDLGPEHGEVAVSEHVFGNPGLGPVGGDADAGRDVEVAAGQHDRRLENLVDAIGDAMRVRNDVAITARAHQDEDELVAAKPGEKVGGANHAS